MPLVQTTFDYTSDDGKRYLFDVDRIKQFIRDNPAKFPVYDIPIDPDYAELCLKTRGVTQDKVDHLDPLPIREPVIYVKWYNGTHFLIDGNHRYVKAAQGGESTIKSFVVRRRFWKLFCSRVDKPLAVL